MKVLLHIGTPKTGSTAIQSALNANWAALAEGGILYPKSLQWHAANHINLYWLSLRSDQLGRGSLVANLSDARAFQARQRHIKDKFRQELDRTKPDRLVLSSEHLSMHLYDHDRVQSLKAVLDEIGADTTVLVYLREQVDLLPSFYGEEIKAGLKQRLQFQSPPEGLTFWDAAMQRRGCAMRKDPNLTFYIDPCPQWMDYDQLLRLWSSVFGEERMKVCRFERESFIGGDILSDFSVQASLPQALNASDVRTNISDSAITTELRRWINRIVPLGVFPKLERRRRRLVMKSWLSVPGKPVSLKPDQAELVFETFKAGNRAVAEKYFNGNSELFTRRPTHSGS